MTVNCIAPGPQKTSFFYNAETPDTIAWLSGMSMNGDLGEPVDVVPVMRFLAAPETGGGGRGRRQRRRRCFAREPLDACVQQFACW